MILGFGAPLMSSPTPKPLPSPAPRLKSPSDVVDLRQRKNAHSNLELHPSFFGCPIGGLRDDDDAIDSSGARLSQRKHPSRPCDRNVQKSRRPKNFRRGGGSAMGQARSGRCFQPRDSAAFYTIDQKRRRSDR